MSTNTASVISNSKFHAAALSLLLLGFSTILLAEPDGSSAVTADEPRSSISLHTVRGGRDNPTVVSESVEDYKALETTGSRNKAKTRGGQLKPQFGSSGAESPSFDFWFYDADVVLFNDDDNDGYYHGIDLLFDVDTNFLAADVYAVMYLSLEGGPWNEYAETEDFTIFGTSSDDEYVLVSELMSGYPTGSYDILIELFDAYDGSFLTSFGPDESSALSFLALEDFDRDEPLQNVQVVVSQGHGGGGSLDGWLLGALLLLIVAGAVRKIWRHRNDELLRIDTPAPCWQDYADLQRRSVK
ncbi:MAG: choice-of-anchor H family protein [Woeseiaceae bacterium]